MPQYQVIRTDYPMEVHAIDCRDLTRKKLDLDWKIEGDTAKAAVSKEAVVLNSEFDNAYDTAELFRIMPCCGE